MLCTCEFYNHVINQNKSQNWKYKPLKAQNDNKDELTDSSVWGMAYLNLKFVCLKFFIRHN